MRVKAAVLREIGKPCIIEELELEGPREGEVLVRYTYCGFCHSDLSFMMSSVPSVVPMVPGHECSKIADDILRNLDMKKYKNVLKPIQVCHITRIFPSPQGEGFPPSPNPQRSPYQSP